MHIPIVDDVNKAKAATFNAGAHVAAAVRAAGDLREAPADSLERHVAAARVVSEVDHVLLGAKDLPGVGAIPYADTALTAYRLARVVLDGASRTPIGNLLPDAVGAANLLAASEHLRGVATITSRDDVSRSQRFQALDLLDDVIDDAQLGFRTLRDSPVQDQALGALATIRRDVADKAPYATAAMRDAAALLEQAATDRLARHADGALAATRTASGA